QVGERISAFRLTLPPLLLGLAVLLVWSVVVRAGLVASYLLPAPSSVVRAFWDSLNDGLLWQYARPTLIESLEGFAVGSLFGLATGYGIARSRLLARMLEPYLAASQALPAIALAPLLVLWLGYGLTPVVVLCALIVFFPVHVNTALGIRTLNREILDAARVDGAGGLAMLRFFEFPLALPSILAGMRAGLTLSITGAVVGEFVIGDRGLGGLLTIARGNFNTPLVFATLFTLAIMASGLYGIGRLVERRLSYLEE
ncbi:MAG TPA: ABC transporter permease, partial [Nitrolancea sp.]|nr:ABC transporter permease [Nitrolancea sp.]